MTFVGSDDLLTGRDDIFVENQITTQFHQQKWWTMIGIDDLLTGSNDPLTGSNDFSVENQITTKFDNWQWWPLTGIDDQKWCWPEVMAF